MSTFAQSVGASYSGLNPVQPKNQLNLNTFINLLTTQLQYQDPTQPMTSDQMASQLTNLGQMQGINQLNQNSQLQQAQSMVGETVTAPRPADSSGSSSGNITGQVVSASFKNNKYQIGIQDANGSVVSVDVSSVTAIQSGSNITQLASFIGKTIVGQTSITTNGTTTNQSVTGTVTGVTNSGGQFSLSVQTANNGTVSISPSEIQQVTN